MTRLGVPVGKRNHISGTGTLLAAGLLCGGRLLAAAKQSALRGNGLLCIFGAVVVVGAGIIWFGFNTGFLTRLSSVNTHTLERNLIATEPALGMDAVAYADPAPASPGPLDTLLGAQQWLNTPPLHSEDIRGKVVVVNFWTYSCINSLRMLPYTRAWSKKYKDRGLVVIGVQTPEFTFEKDVANVSKALVSLGVNYPVAIDNDHRIWQAFHNQVWPALYFIGADGRIRHHEFGEGGYDRSERLIQKLLSETSGGPVPNDLVANRGTGPQAAADEKDQLSPETYLGYAKAEFSSDSISEDTPRLYRTESALALNRWSLGGVWTIGGEFATLNDTPGSITYRFHARDLHFVLARSSQGHPIRFRVKIDGAPPGADHGVDVDAQGWGTVQEDRMYQLIRQKRPVADRTFEIEFFDAGVRAYDFTFG